MKLVNIASPDFEYDGGDPEGFRAGMARLGKLLGASESGASVYEIPPGQAICPYHYEVGNETEETVRVLMFSTVVVPTATVYPDSDKIGIWTGEPETDVLVRRENAVDYFDREGGASIKGDPGPGDGAA